MSQPSVNPAPSPYTDPTNYRSPSSTANAPPASEAHNPAALTAKATVEADYSDPTVVSTTTTAAGTLKRPRDEDAEGVEAGTWTDFPEAKRRVKATHDVIYRIVVPSRQIGKVIGRGGHRIQKIRDDTRATIKIADAISRNEERVIIISSKDSDNIFSDAENALHQIVTLILKEDGGDAEALKAGHVPANAVRLLIAGSQAGGLIGVSGQNIVNLRNSSGATITVLSPNQLPPCASAHESDRVVQVSGEIPTVLSAVVEIGCQLRDNPPKQVISISPAPTNNAGVHRQPQSYVDPNSADYVTLDEKVIIKKINLAADYVTLELMVPENLVGGLIGRFGANISRIRNESGANIKVYGGKGEHTQRQIHLGGSTQQVALAKQRVDEYVYAELMRQAGGQLQQTAGQMQQYPIQQPMPDLSNTLYQSYGHPHGLYATSNHEAGVMATLPPMYASTAAAQAPPYYAHPSYPAPQL